MFCLFSRFGFSARRGLTLIEVVVGTAVMLVVFLGIFAAFQLSIDLVYSTKAATTATSLLNDRIEYIRGLSYDAVGTVGGIPSGTIPQVEQVAINGVTYAVSTLIQYVDDPVDGLDAADTNGVTADYKLIRVSANWTIRGKPRSSFALTTLAPTGIETLAAGGTLRVNVFDSQAAPVSGALVTVVNSSTAPAINLSVTTGASGSVAFPGAPPASGYQVTTTRNGYSTAQTYPVTTENQNPNPGHVTIQNQVTTTLSLSIDALGSLLTSTFSPVGPKTFVDSFADESKLAATSSVRVSNGSLILTDDAGTYAAEGTAVSASVYPSFLTRWTSFSWNATTPAGTDVKVTVYYLDGTTFVPVPNSALPGNNTGFSGGFIDLSGLPVATYGTLRMYANLSTADTSVTPEVADWTLAYSAGPTPLPNVGVNIHGAKTIGISAGGTPIYKYNSSFTTTQYGTWSIDPMEADAYILTLPSGSPYSIAELCPASPAVSPGAAASVSMTLENASTNSLRVVVLGAGTPVAYATSTLSGNSVNETKVTSACGQTFFGGIPAGTYTLSVSLPGYQTAVDNAVSVTGASVITIALTPQ